MAIKLSLLSLFCLAAFTSTTNAWKYDGYDPWVHYCRLPAKNGKFMMLGKPWENESKQGIKGKRVIFDCSTNDPKANVKLQYYAYKWHDVVKRVHYGYPKGSVVRRGQVFILKKYNGQQGRFRCMAKSKGKRICKKLGLLTSA